MNFVRFEEQDKVAKIQTVNSKAITEVKNDSDTDSANLEQLKIRLNKITDKIGKAPIEFAGSTYDELNEYIVSVLPTNGNKTHFDMRNEMQSIDYIVTSCIGGLAAILDAFLVKIPKDTSIVRNKVSINQEGSKLTGVLRNIGIKADGKAADWVKVLETYFKVPYDKSVDSDIAGFCPNTHRLHSLAHDPSISGLFWAVKDLICGTMTCIDKKGTIHIIKVANADLSKLLSAPLFWFGHIISDVFTKMGIPIPGWSYLQLLQFGSFGDKERTIADLARFMYLNGYDLRHLVTMSTVNVVIEFFIHMYIFLTQEKTVEDFLISEKEYKRIKQELKKRYLHFIAYSVATCGNVVKVIAYQGNPSAVNIPLWYAMIKEAVGQCAILIRNSKDYEKAIENRHVVDENFDWLYSLLKEKGEK